MDRERPGRSRGGDGVCLQRADAQLPDVAEQYSRPGLDAMGGVAGRTSLARRRTESPLRDSGGRAANARRRARDHSVHLAGGWIIVRRGMDPPT